MFTSTVSQERPCCSSECIAQEAEFASTGNTEKRLFTGIERNLSIRATLFYHGASSILYDGNDKMCER